MRGVKVPASPRRATLTPLILPAFNGNQAALSHNPKIASRIDRRAAGSGTRHWQRRSSLQIKYNPPFSDKSWSDGLKPEKDDYHRFEGFGIPPEKNGDFAWFLHVIKSLDSKGKAGIVMPHGVLFRGNAEETIRKQILARRYIKGIVSLPANLFYGTGIPACLVFIDKEDAETREGIFFIDASNGYKKDGNKNRLREQDIEKIVRVYTAQEEIKGYSRFVPYSESLSMIAFSISLMTFLSHGLMAIVLASGHDTFAT